MNPFKRIRIDLVLFICFALVISASLIIAIYLAYNISNRELASTSSTYQQLLLEKVNRQVTAEMRTIESTSLAAYRYPDLDFFDPRAEPFSRYNVGQKYRAYLRNIVYSLPALQAVDVYVESPPTASEAQDYIHYHELERIRDRSYYSAIERADFAWVGDHLYEESSRGSLHVISFARKMYLSSGEYLGVIVFHLKTAAIQAILADNSTSQRILIDEAGRYVTSVGMSAEKVTDVLRHYEKLGRISVGGSQRIGNDLFVWDKSISSEWTLLEVTPWKAVTAGSFTIAKTLLVIVFVTLLIALLSAFAIARNFFRPLRALLNAMNRYSISKSATALPDDYTNEFGSLFIGYRRLIDRIEELYASLKDRYRKQKEAEVQALQSNINPHFLYNTLDQLNWMAVDRGADDISEVLEWMGRMFRIGLSNGATFIPLEQEIEHVRCYSEIIRIRTKGRIVFDFRIPGELGAYYVPKIILQPFVENAVVHAFAGRDGGTVTIAGEASAGRLVLHIDDDGTGFAPDWRKPRIKSGGYGIRNVEQRFESLFRGRAGITIVSEPKRAGTSVELRMPLLLTPNEVDVDDHVENMHY